MQVLAVLLAVVACAFAQSEIQCREGWDAADNSCYKVVDMKVHWVEAWAYCTTMRSSLVEINSEEEQTAIAGLLKDKYSTYYPQFWMGMTDLSTEGEWKLTRFNENASYLNWIPGQPNNDNGKGEHCAHINAKSFRNYQWNDHSCNAELNFICEDTPLA